MANAVKAIPDGYHTITPYLSIRGAAQAIEFYKKAFGVTELFRMNDEKHGRIGHAELQFGTSRFMLADEYPEISSKSPQSYGGTPVTLTVYVENVDEVFNRAVQCGAKVKRPLATQFYGDRTGTVEDPFGHVWHFSQHVEDVSPEEMERRAKQQR